MDSMVIMGVLSILVFLGLGMMLGSCLVLLAVERKIERGENIVWRTDNGRLIKITYMKER